MEETSFTTKTTSDFFRTLDKILKQQKGDFSDVKKITKLEGIKI